MMVVKRRAATNALSQFRPIAEVNNVTAKADQFTVSLVGVDPGNGKSFLVQISRNELALLNKAASR